MLPILLIALAAGGGPVGSPELNTVTKTVTTPDGGPLVFFVDTRGNDLNTCTAAFTDGGRNGPCATPQGATNRMPKLLRHGVLVNVAPLPDAGPASYPCFYFGGFTEDPGSAQGLNAGVLFDGQLVADTVATGTATGTATAVSTGSGVTFGTMDDSTQSWTVNNLQGKLVTITSGTGTGTVRVISSNTATQFTIVGTWPSPVPVVGSGYAIVQPGWGFSAACPTPPNMTAAAVANQSTVYLFGNRIDYRASSLHFRNVFFSPPAGTGLQVADDSSVAVTNYKCNTPGGVCIATIQNGSPRINLSVGSFTGATTTYMASVAGQANYTIANCLAYGANAGLVLSPLGAPGGPFWSIASSESTNSTVAGINIATTGTSRGIAQISRFNCASSAGFGIIVGGRGSSAVTTLDSFAQANMDFPQVVIGSTCGVGIAVVGPSTATVSTFSGTVATTGYLVNFGGRLSLLTGTSLTGGVQDFSLDNGAVTGTLGSISTGTCTNTSATGYGSRICK